MSEKVKCPVGAGLAKWADIGSFSEYLCFRKSSAKKIEEATNGQVTMRQVAEGVRDE